MLFSCLFGTKSVILCHKQYNKWHYMEYTELLEKQIIGRL